MLKRRAWAGVVGLGLLGALVAAFLWTAGPAAAAVPPAGGVARAAGTIATLGASQFTMQGAAGRTITVTVAANTWIVVKGASGPAQGTFADLKVGDKVAVAGTSAGTDQIAARVVDDGVRVGAIARAAGGRANAAARRAAQALSRAAVHGTVQANSNGTLTIAAGQGTNARTVQVRTDAGTVVLKNGLAPVAALQVGDTATILARPAAAAGATPAAGAARTAVVIYVPAPDHVVAPAVVKAVNGNTLQLRGLRQAARVTVSDATTIEQLSATGQAPAPATLADLQAGTRVLVYAPNPARGQPAAATVILILPQPARPAAPTPGGL